MRAKLEDERILRGTGRGLDGGSGQVLGVDQSHAASVYAGMGMYKGTSRSWITRGLVERASGHLAMISSELGALHLRPHVRGVSLERETCPVSRHIHLQ